MVDEAADHDECVLDSLTHGTCLVSEPSAGIQDNHKNMKAKGFTCQLTKKQHTHSGSILKVHDNLHEMHLNRFMFYQPSTCAFSSS